MFFFLSAGPVTTRPELARARPTRYFIIIIVVLLFLFTTKRLLNRKLRGTNNDYNIYIKIIRRGERARVCVCA